jgi:ATP-binding cassette subfamily B protein
MTRSGPGRAGEQTPTLAWLVRRFWLPLLGVALSSGAQAAAGLAFPLLIRKLVDDVLPSGSRGYLLQVSAAFAGVAALIVVFTFAASYCGALAAEGANLTLRAAITETAFGPAGAAPSNRSGDLAHLVVQDVDVVGRLFAGTMGQSVFQAVRFLGALIVIALIDWRVLAVAPVAVVLFAVVPAVTRRRLARASREVQEAGAEMLSRSSEAFSDRRGLRAARGGPWASGRLRASFEASRRARLRLARMTVVGQVGYLALWVVYGGTYFFAGLQALDGRLSAGSVLALGQLIAGLALPNQALAELFTEYTASLGAVARIGEFLTGARPSPFAPPGRGRRDDHALPLQLRGLSVAFGPAAAVDGVGLRVGSGEWVALVGPSGAGKSTVLAVAAGLLAPDAGEVTAGPDGAALGLWDEDAYRARVAACFGDGPLYRGSIADNVRLGRGDIDEAAMGAALTLVDASQFGSRSGADAIDEGGRNVSSGQRQRILLARALAGRPDLLLLDEATAALDSEAETALLARLREARPDLAVVLVSHRLSSVLRCDRVVVLDGGRLVEEGPTLDLLSGAGRFEVLVRDQVILRP